MNRRYTQEAYADKVAKLRQACPGICLTTDLIVGFPGETERDFQATLDLMREAGFEAAFSFKYSPRPNTRAAALPDQVPEAIKAERLSRLQAVQDELTQASHQRLVGQVREVLVEGRSKRSGDQLSGRLRTNQVVNFTGSPDLVGSLVMVEITEAHPHSLKGRWVKEAPVR
jgi:tRNA-2-methylthio-N6-dimethylallyladenosine synthase